MVQAPLVQLIGRFGHRDNFVTGRCPSVKCQSLKWVIQISQTSKAKAPLAISCSYRHVQTVQFVIDKTSGAGNASEKILTHMSEIKPMNILTK